MEKYNVQDFFDALRVGDLTQFQILHNIKNITNYSKIGYLHLIAFLESYIEKFYNDVIEQDAADSQKLTIQEVCEYITSRTNFQIPYKMLYEKDTVQSRKRIFGSCIDEVKLIKIAELHRCYDLLESLIQTLELEFGQKNSKYKCLNITYDSDNSIDKLNVKLNEYNFFHLEKVKILSPEKQQNLVKMIFSGNMGYTVAMLEFLGFFDYLQSEVFKTKKEMFQVVSLIFEYEKSGRSISGQHSSLSPMYQDLNGKYNAYKYKDQVNIDYQQLI
jgi:hypothetical protein